MSTAYENLSTSSVTYFKLKLDTLIRYSSVGILVLFCHTSNDTTKVYVYITERSTTLRLRFHFRIDEIGQDVCTFSITEDVA